MINLYGSDLIGRIDANWTSQYDPEADEYVDVRTDSRKYYVKDHLGSIRQTLSESGVVQSAMDYYAFGGTMSSYVNGSTVDKYRFTGKERDLETGLDYFGARYYDSKIGRWMSVDPLAEKYLGYSPYNYCGNNPLKHVDIDGRDYYVILAPKGANGFGHAAQVIGNEKTGWVYISKDGTRNDGIGVNLKKAFGSPELGYRRGNAMPFTKFMELINSERKSAGHKTNYVFAVKITTTGAEQDDRMIAEALKTATLRYILGSDDCIGNVSSTLESEGYDGGNDGKISSMYPNNRFFNIFRENHGQLIGLSNYSEGDDSDEWVKRVQREMREKEEQQQ